MRILGIPMSALRFFSQCALVEAASSHHFIPEGFKLVYVSLSAAKIHSTRNHLVSAEI